MASKKRRKNVFVVGMDEEHERDLHAIPDEHRFRFHELLPAERVIQRENYDVDALLDEAREVLDDFDEPVDAIISHWDFPVTCMIPVLCQERGLRSPSREAVLKCEHKYWSRVEQRRHAPENTPDFCAVDPFGDDPWSQLTIDTPFWIKPVKGYSSILGFRIDTKRDFVRAMDQVREEIPRFGEPFNRFLSTVDLPDEIRAVDGNHLVAEQLVGGWELAPEGRVQHGVFSTHAMFDMVRGPNHASFLAYRYPAVVSEEAQERAIEAARKVLTGIGYDDGCFNVEFFWDQDTDDLWIIEINPRISASHCYLFEAVDGMSNHEIAIHVALGDEPKFEHGKGRFRHAAKFMMRRYGSRDAVCSRVPSEEDVAKLKERQPDTEYSSDLKPGMKLSELKDQDAYSHVLAVLLIGGKSAEDLRRKYEQAKALLPFEFESLRGLPLDSTGVIA